MFAERCQEVRVKVAALIVQHENRTGQKVPHIDIRFDLRGRAAGQAIARGWNYSMRFNKDMMLNQGWDHLITDTVPHELAHIICFANGTDRGHGYNWKRTCQALGGSGERFHKEKVIMTKGTTYEYITDRGHRVCIGDKHHTFLKKPGSYLRFPQGLGTITQNSAHSIIGVNGRPLSTPNEKNTPLSNADSNKGMCADPISTPVMNANEHGQSKAATSRRIMLSGHNLGKTYEEIISAMMAACGYDRQLARATYRANASKIGIPVL